MLCDPEMLDFEEYPEKGVALAVALHAAVLAGVRERLLSFGKRASAALQTWYLLVPTLANCQLGIFA